ncbi:MAG: cache and HAMP domain-containing protein [Candidatus Cloacimonetes bacterium]|nr:cache and HAMP domain-containing protein [Candidatus Cloacimonadota bacterium]
MRNWDSISLRMNLAFLTIALMSAGFVGLILYQKSRDALKEEVIRGLANTSQILRDNLESRIQSATNLVDTLTQRPEFSNLNFPRIQETTEHFVQFADLFYNLFIYDLEGSVKTAAYLDRRDITPYLQENFNQVKTDFPGYARQVLADGKPRFTGVFRVTDTHLLVAYIAPIKKEEKTIGLISCGIHLNDPKLENLMKSFSPAKGGFVLLLEPSGKILSRGGVIDQELTSLDPNLWKDRNGTSLPLTSTQKSYLFHTKSVGVGGLTLLTAIPDDVLKTTIEELGQSLAVYTLIALIISLFLSSWIARTFISPISALVKGLKSVGEGVYTHNIEESASGEMGEAITAYNEMIEKLQKKRVIEKIWMENWDV